VSPARSLWRPRKPQRNRLAKLLHIPLRTNTCGACAGSVWPCPARLRSCLTANLPFSWLTRSTPCSTITTTTAATWPSGSPPGAQATLIKTEPLKFFRPPYVGVKGWVGVDLEAVDDEELGFYLSQAWRLIAPKKTIRDCGPSRRIVSTLSR